ncbi:MAG TPA: hypothetical protein VIL86_09340 [Tepidisphaeraceae bacterium]|jgi:hypothetical protein
MAKAKKPKAIKLKRPENPQDVRQFWRGTAQLIGAILFVGVCALGFRTMKHWVEHRLAFPAAPPKVVLLNRPVWMSDTLAERIAAAARPAVPHSALDHQLLVNSVEMLRTNPWIAKVNEVRRVYGQAPGDTIEIDCDYRAPIALVRWVDAKTKHEAYWFVDAQGVKLPEEFAAADLPRLIFGQNGRVNLRIVEGVQCPPPVHPGQRWTGDDLYAGLELVRALYGLPYTEEIQRVDVSNFQGRIDPREAQLVLVTNKNTEIRWGHPLHSTNFEVSDATKLNYLQKVRAQYGRVDGNWPWLDIRFDKITHPAQLPADAHADTR